MVPCLFLPLFGGNYKFWCLAWFCLVIFGNKTRAYNPPRGTSGYHWHTKTLTLFIRVGPFLFQRKPFASDYAAVSRSHGRCADPEAWQHGHRAIATAGGHQGQDADRSVGNENGAGPKPTAPFRAGSAPPAGPARACARQAVSWARRARAALGHGLHPGRVRGLPAPLRVRAAEPRQRGHPALRYVCPGTPVGRVPAQSGGRGGSCGWGAGHAQLSCLEEACHRVCGEQRSAAACVFHCLLWELFRDREHLIPGAAEWWCSSAQRHRGAACVWEAPAWGAARSKRGCVEPQVPVCPRLEPTSPQPCAAQSPATGLGTISSLCFLFLLLSEEAMPYSVVDVCTAVPARSYFPTPGAG